MKAATITIQAAALAVFLVRPTVAQAAAIGVAALALLLAVDTRNARFLKGRKEMLATAALLTAAAVATAPFHIGALGVAAPLAILAVYLAATLSPRLSLPRLRNRGTARDPR